MSDTSRNPNIEWKKGGFDSSEKSTRRINEQKATQYDAFKRNGASKITELTPTDLPQGLNKIRKKIRDIYDEEDDENEDGYQIVPNLLQTQNSLLNALSEEEKQALDQKENLDNMALQQNAGKMEALATAEKLAKTVGLVKGLQRKTVAQAMVDVAQPEQVLQNVIKKDIIRNLKIRGNKLPEKDIKKFFMGIKRIEAIGGGKQAVQGLNVNEVVNAGETKTKDQKIAQMLLNKSGRSKPKNKKIKTKSSEKAQKEFNQMVVKNAQLKSMEK